MRGRHIGASVLSMVTQGLMFPSSCDSPPMGKRKWQALSVLKHTVRSGTPDTPASVSQESLFGLCSQMRGWLESGLNEEDLASGSLTFHSENVKLRDGQLAGSAMRLGFHLKPVSPHFSKQEAGCQCPRRTSKPAVLVYGLES